MPQGLSSTLEYQSRAHSSGKYSVQGQADSDAISLAQSHAAQDA